MGFAGEQDLDWIPSVVQDTFQPFQIFKYEVRPLVGREPPGKPIVRISGQYTAGRLIHAPVALLRPSDPPLLSQPVEELAFSQV